MTGGCVCIIYENNTYTRNNKAIHCVFIRECVRLTQMLHLISPVLCLIWCFNGN